MQKTFMLLFFIVLTNKAIAQKPFITVWKIENETSGNYKLQFPTLSKLSIQWIMQNDSTIKGKTEIDSANRTIAFPRAGTYIVKATPPLGKTISISFEYGDEEAKKLLEVKQWGTAKWKSMYKAFYRCKNLDVTATDKPDLSLVKSMEMMFRGCEKLIGNVSINTWDVQNITSMDMLFSDCFLFNQPLGNWNTTNVTVMSSMFSGAQTFNQPIGNWNTKNVTEMYFMFYNAEKFNQPIGNWNTSNVGYMGAMFMKATTFNQPIGSWNVGKVITMERMFESAVSFNQNISNWKLLPGTNIEAMFYKALAYNNRIKDEVRPFITVWKTDNKGMTKDNQVRFNAHLGGTEFLVKWEEKDNPQVHGEAKINYWDSIITFPKPGIYIVKAYLPLFEKAFIGFEPDIALFNDNMHIRDNNKLLLITQWGDAFWSHLSYAFSGCKNLDITAKDIPNLKRCEKLIMLFKNCNSLKYNESINDWDVSNIKDFTGLFAGCNNFNQPLDKWNTANVTSMSNTFRGCSSFNQPINTWNTSKVSDMAYMFSGCKEFNQPLNNWKTINVSDMAGMFKGCSLFNQDINNWNVKYLKYAGFMFAECPLYNKPLNKWDVSNVQHITCMFLGATSFQQDLSLWKFNNLTESKNVFTNATAYKSVRFKEISVYEADSALYASKKWEREREFNQWYKENIQRSVDAEKNAKATSCKTSIDNGITSAISCFNKWKIACEEMYNGNSTSNTGGTIDDHCNCIIKNLEQINSTLRSGKCDDMGYEKRDKLEVTINKKLNGFREFQREYKKANKKPTIWEALIGGLQIATGTY